MEASDLYMKSPTSHGRQQLQNFRTRAENFQPLSGGGADEAILPCHGAQLLHCCSTLLHRRNGEPMLKLQALRRGPSRYRGSRLIIAGTLAMGAALSLHSPASAGTICDQKGGEFANQVTDTFNARAAQLDAAIAEMRKAGRDPSTVALKMPDGRFLTLLDLKTELQKEAAGAMAEVKKVVHDCNEDLKVPNDIAKGAVTIATGGLNLILPERMTRIDVGQILAGYPLGSQEAFIPKLREQILDGLGLKNDNGFVTNLIRDPIRTILGTR